ncbi:F-box/RNI-like superfamily protein [Rhynchospora pubera]|uniref:F-box/RNI-like superfamily protein n=1 Tax=Rhynchospora pubera TaxID=906938 RepID=A0AAV8CBQ2_9POAL|nr:F-box/RNI-like superfamily protein [Rhynchospora pubera]
MNNKGNMTQPKPAHKPFGTSTRSKKVPTTVDRISILPDHVLHHILSFIPLKQAGRTSILSRRWRYVWASLQGLTFYKDELAKFGLESFIRYVNAALPYRAKQDFQIFKTFLFSTSPTYLATSTRWITQAVNNDVGVLYLIIRGGNVILPRPVLTSQSLEELGLFSFPSVKIITPSIISLSRLRILSLQRMEINSAFFEKIISGCAMLENLNLHFCEITFSRVHSMVLRKLVMESCTIRTKRENKFYICTPNLVHLHFNQGCGTLSHHETPNQMFELDLPNLKSLILGGNWVRSYPDAVLFFLQHSPMLEKLTLIFFQMAEINNIKLLDGSINLRFQCQNLKSVEIICHQSDERILHLTKVLKENGISNLNLTRRFSFVENDCLKMLYDVWYWINVWIRDQKISRKRTRRRSRFRPL